MGVIRTISTVGCIGGLLSGCMTMVQLPVDVPLEGTASYTGTDCFFEVSMSSQRKVSSPPKFVRKDGTDRAKTCVEQQTVDASLYPGLRLRPGYTLEITALDAGQVLQRSRSGRHAQSTIPHLMTLPIRHVSPVTSQGRLTALEEGVLLAALTTRRRLCFSGSEAACTNEQWAKEVRLFFDAHAIDLWNALIDSARLIPIDRALYSQTAETDGHGGVRWGLFISHRRVCEGLIDAKTNLSDADKVNLAKIFTGFYGNKTKCERASDMYYMVPRYLVGGPNALVLAAIVQRDFIDLKTKEGFLGKPVMARYSAIAIRPRGIVPERPGSARDWTLEEWEWSGICDPRARVRHPDEQQRLAIRSFVPKPGYPVIEVLPPSAKGDTSTYELVEVADDSKDDAFIRNRILRLKDGFSKLYGHDPTLPRVTLNKLYLDDVVALTWHRTTADGNWTKAGDAPPAGCNFGQIQGGW